MNSLELLERLREVSTELTRLHAVRDRAIRDAYAANVPVTAIAAAVGLSRMQVHRIVRPETNGGNDK